MGGRGTEGPTELAWVGEGQRAQDPTGLAISGGGAEHFMALVCINQGNCTKKGAA